MFGLGFTEILLIAIVAVIALGPEKLPTAMVQIAKFINKFKSGLAEAKSTLDSELNVSQMKEEATKFKSQIEETKASLTIENKLDLGLNDIFDEDDKKEKKIEKSVENTNKDFDSSTQKVSFKKEDKA